MLKARILPHLCRKAIRGLWPVCIEADGVAVSLHWLATPIAQAVLDASRAGTLTAFA